MKRIRENQGGLFRIQIRALLRAHPQGLTVKEIMRFIDGKNGSVYRAIKRMPDAYCAGWERPGNGKIQAVFRVVKVPADCPHPAELPPNHSIRTVKLDPIPKPAKELAAVLVKPKKKTAAGIEEERRMAAFTARYVTPFIQKEATQ